MVKIKTSKLSVKWKNRSSHLLPAKPSWRENWQLFSKVKAHTLSSSLLVDLYSRVIFLNDSFLVVRMNRALLNRKPGRNIRHSFCIKIMELQDTRFVTILLDIHIHRGEQGRKEKKQQKKAKTTLRSETSKLDSI
jgi:hypothetical protein